MKVTAEMLQAALRRKRSAAGEQAGPPKRARAEDRGETVAALSVPEASMPTGEPAHVEPAGGSASAPADAEREEGEIVAATGAVLIDLDSEDTAQATAGERAPSLVGAKRTEARRAEADRRRPRKTRAEPGRDSVGSGSQGAEAGGSYRHPPMHRPTHQTPDESLGGPARPPPRLLTLSDAGRATALLSRTRTSASDEEMGRLSPAALLDTAMVNVLQLANVAFAFEGAMVHSAESMMRVLARSEKYKAQSRSLSEDLTRLRSESKTREEESKAREEALTARVREAECQAQIENTRATAAEARAALVTSRLESSDLRIDDLAGQLRQLEDRLEVAREEARVAVEEKAAAEEAAVAATQERAKEAARADEAEGRAREAETKALEAEARAGTAVADYKASADFVQEVVEASLGAYVEGFDLCKARISAAFNLGGPKLDKIQSGDTGGGRD